LSESGFAGWLFDKEFGHSIALSPDKATISPLLKLIDIMGYLPNSFSSFGLNQDLQDGYLQKSWSLHSLVP
jgi:hypothetical protein